MCIGKYYVVLTLDSLSYIWTCFCLLKLKCRGKKVRFAERKRSLVNIRLFKTLKIVLLDAKSRTTTTEKLASCKCCSCYDPVCPAVSFSAQPCSFYSCWLYSLFSAVRHHGMERNCSCRHDPASYIRSLCKHIFLYFSPFSTKDEIVIS